LLCLCSKERKALAFAFLCFSLLVKSQFEILGFLVSSSIIIIVYAQRFYFFLPAGMLFFSFLDWSFLLASVWLALLLSFVEVNESGSLPWIFVPSQISPPLLLQEGRMSICVLLLGLLESE
jgi:asparagine N-glycosylation enzyme membrane subunit Stt3